MYLEFTIPGSPVPKGRPRFDKRTRRAYTPPRTRQYEKHVGSCGWAATLQLKSHEAKYWPVTDRRLYADIEIYFEKKATQAADADNIVKSILDGLEGVLYQNDRQVLPRVQGLHYECDKPCVKVKFTIIE